MKKYFQIITLLFILAALLPKEGNAAIRSIIDDSSTTNDYRPSKPINCKQRGFYLTSCPKGKVPQNLCPSDNTHFKHCICNTAIYKHNKTNCTDGKILSGEICNGKYESCICNPKIYPYNKSNCASQKILSGNSCDKNYEDCKCSSRFSKECAYPLVGNSEKCDNYYTSCKCSSSFKSCPSGPDKGAETCKEPSGNGIKYSKCFTMPQQ